MTDEDWARMRRIVSEDSDEPCTPCEIEALQDWIYDEIAGRLQTVPGTTVLQ